MTAVLLPSASAIHTTHHHHHTQPESNPSTAVTTIAGYPRGAAARAGEEDQPTGAGGRGGLPREPLSAVDPNMSRRRQAKVVVDYNEAGSGKGKGRDGVNGLGATGTTSSTGKRKAVNYEEDIEGFQFSRATQPKRSRPSPVAPEPTAEGPSSPPQQPTQKQKGRGRPAKKNAASSKQRPSTDAPNGDTVEANSGQRRSKRLADDASTTPVAKQSKTRRKDDAPKKAAERGKGQSQLDREDEDKVVVTQTHHAETKIALPMADTPVIRKNKEMRQEKGKKASSGAGQRRSSLGMRGRRASSLIESGVSNALPHDAVDAADFYKHIEGEGLPEPRRMKQLLTWCATRALGKKPSGSRSEDESARLAARVIQEELLKDLGNRSELSDWFGREETTPPPVVVKKPNPRNTQNADKIKELEDHIQKLQAERQSLAALLKAPSIPRLASPPPPSSNDPQPGQESQSTTTTSLNPESINSSLLDPSQQSLLSILNEKSPSTSTPSEDPKPKSRPQRPPAPSDGQTQGEDAKTSTQSTPITSVPAISSRLSSLELTPSLDALAAGIHDVELYRRAADGLAGSILGICARRLEERDSGPPRQGSAEPLGVEDTGGEGPQTHDDNGDGGGGEDDSARRPEARREGEDLRVVLGALSRLERR